MAYSSVVLFLVATLAAASFAQDFAIKDNTRCSGHYRVASWETNALEECQVTCQTDEKCAHFSLELKGQGCFLFDTEATCVSSEGWTTGHKDTRCAQGEEDSIVNLQCPFGTVISAITFASYGSPTGVCGSYAEGTCHQDSTKSIVEDVCLGESSCTISVSDHVFGNPCEVVNKNFKAEVQCAAGPAFNEDVYFNAWSSRSWADAQKEVFSRKTEWQSLMTTLPTYPAGKFSGKGIIIVAGGRYLQPAIVMIKMLRQAGCTLRIQVWHLGSSEMTSEYKALLEPYNVETRDFEDFVSKEQLKPIPANVGLRLFQLKPLALLHTDLEDVLLLDSDNCPIRDPAYLFESLEYKQYGTVFWPDYWRTSIENPIWSIIGAEPTDTWEQESGQLMMNKEKAWKAINLAVHLNQEFYMQLLNGDKDTFRFSWIAAAVPFFMVESWPTAVGTLKELHSTEAGFCSHTMLQHDFEGKPIFVHHNQLKNAHLPVGQNFKYQKSTKGMSTFKAVPAAGIQVASGTIPCIDIQGLTMPNIDADVVAVQETELAEFEVRYFATLETVPQAPFESNDSPRLLGNGPEPVVSVRGRRMTCANGTFELAAAEVCEPITECVGSETEVSAAGATTDTQCTPNGFTPASLSGDTYTRTFNTRGNPNTGTRFGAAFNPDAIISTYTSSGLMGNTRRECEQLCSNDATCVGVFVYRTTGDNVCNMLRFLGTETATNTNSWSYTRDS